MRGPQVQPFTDENAMYLVFSSLLQPLPVLFLALGICLLMQGWRSRGRRKSWAVLAGLYLLLLLDCLPLVAHFAAGLLEWSFRPLPERPPQAEAIVVLGGGLIPPAAPVVETRLCEDTLRRCFQAADLYRQGARCPVVVTGGKVDKSKPGQALAPVMHDVLVRLGVRDSDILVEDASTDTYENAVFSQALLASRGITSIVLVTDATHLGRATQRFTDQGLTVFPAASHYFASEAELGDWRLFLPSPRAAVINNAVFHELLGFVWNWVQGRQ